MTRAFYGIIFFILGLILVPISFLIGVFACVIGGGMLASGTHKMLK